MLFRNIDKGDLKRLVDVVSKNRHSIRLSGIFVSLQSDAKIGCVKIIGGGPPQLLLTMKDILKIRQLFINEVKYDLLKGMPSTRREASILNIGTEKVSVMSPKETVIEIRSFDGQVRLNTQKYNIPPNASLSVSFLQISTIEHSAILLVENYEAFIHADLSLLSDEVKDALIVYRGDTESGDVKKFLLSLKVKGISVYGWFDGDPHGINMALSTPNIKGFYLPENNIETYRIYGKGKPYEDQVQFISAHKKSSIGYVREAVKVFESARACLMQESILVNKIPLCLVLSVGH